MIATATARADFVNRVFWLMTITSLIIFIQTMLHAVTGARSVGSAVRLRNQTSGESIGLTS
ncbi:hypothetical protein DQD25_17255 [Salmonella enterica subsp. enterica]|nr:hypothetical protein [Salmonella enterica subsp. enterica serovar Enteritidis]